MDVGVDISPAGAYALSNIPNAVVAELGTLHRSQPRIHKGLVGSSLVCIFKTLTAEHLGDIDRRLCLLTVYERKRCLAKLTQY